VDIDSLIRRPPMAPFAPGAGLPWNEPAFSQRMLREHLSQHHDRASRRFEIIDQQVAWIHQSALGGKPGRVLDLGCGPGLHTQRLAQLGHQCTGLDFSPASITYAKDKAARAQLDCEYRLVDLRVAELGSAFDVVLMLYGEFNTLAEADAQSLLGRIHSALAPSGRVILELHYDDYVRALGEQAPSWSARPAGLFADAPHLVLHEACWHAEVGVATERYWVFGESGEPSAYSLDTQAYSNEELEEMFGRAGLSVTGHYESLTGDFESEAELFGLVGERRPGGPVASS